MRSMPILSINLMPSFLISSQNLPAIQTDQQNLAVSLSDYCEVHEIDDSGHETYLGPISRKALFTLAADIAEPMIHKYMTANASDAILALRYIRQTINEDLLDDELREKIDSMSCLLNVSLIDNSTSVGHGVYAILYWSNYNDNSWFSQSISYLNYCIGYEQQTRILRNLERNKESLRQGQYIIDFLKAGKHLFLV